jgi:hypothetical protein
MSKRLTAVFILLISVSLVHAQATWITYKIDSKLSIKMPSEPTKQTDYSVYARDADTTIYVVATIDMYKAEKLDSAQIATQAPTQEFADNFRTGMLSQMKGATLDPVKISKWKGYTCYTIDGEYGGNKLKLYSFMVLAGVNVYSLMVIMPDSHSPKKKDDFFNSLTLN